MNAKTIASLLPFFVASGVSIAGLTSDIHTGTTTISPNWAIEPLLLLVCRPDNIGLRLYRHHQLFSAISELITTHRLQMQYLSANDEKEAPQTLQGADSSAIDHADARRCYRAFFIGIGMFRYTPHPILHNVSSRSSLPDERADDRCCLLALQLSKVVYVISDPLIGIGALAGFQWLWRNMLTNVEALAGMMFLGWFIIFSRQIAAIESDRVQIRSLFWQNQAARIRRGSCGGQRNRSGTARLVGSLIFVTVHEHSPLNNTAACHPHTVPRLVLAIRNRSSLWWAFYRSSATGSFSTAP